MIGTVPDVSAPATLRVLDLFCGEKNWSRPAVDRGHVVVTSDFDDVYAPDLVADIFDLSVETIVDALGGFPDLVLASPPCQGFTIVRIGKNWTAAPDKVHYPHRGSTPKTEKAELGVRLVARTLELIEALSPSWWLMENPVGKLRKLPVVGGITRHTVTYCRYGRPFRKPTDLWGAPPQSWVPEPRCEPGGPIVVVEGEEWVTWNGSPCHMAAPRGSRTGVQGRKRLTTTAVPYPLAEAVTIAAEQDHAAGRFELAGQQRLV